MNIVIMGAGTVGTFVADTLCAEQHNVTIIDQSRRALEQIEERVDVQTICGSACDSAILFQAGVLGADLCLAVTSQDLALLAIVDTRLPAGRYFPADLHLASTLDVSMAGVIADLLSDSAHCLCSADVLYRSPVNRNTKPLSAHEEHPVAGQAAGIYSK